MKNFRFKEPNILHSWEISTNFPFWYFHIAQIKWVYIFECWITKRFQLGDWKKTFCISVLKKNFCPWEGSQVSVSYGGDVLVQVL